VLAHQRIGEALGLEELRMHAGHHDLLVVRAIEDADPAALRARVWSAREVVVELVWAGLLEGVYVTALGLTPDITCLIALSLRRRPCPGRSAAGPAILSVQLLLHLAKDGGALLEEISAWLRDFTRSCRRITSSKRTCRHCAHSTLGQTDISLRPACLHDEPVYRACLPCGDSTILGHPVTTGKEAAMSRNTPVASNSLTVRLRLANKPGMLGRITSAIGEAGGDIGAVDVVEPARRR